MPKVSRPKTFRRVRDHGVQMPNRLEHRKDLYALVCHRSIRQLLVRLVNPIFDSRAIASELEKHMVLPPTCGRTPRRMTS